MALAPIALCVVLCGGCQSDNRGPLTPVDKRQESPNLIDPVVLRGTVTYTALTALPAGSVITVQLLNVSIADAPAAILGKHTITTTGQNVPIPFAITYDRALVKPNGVYAATATITINGRVAFRNTTQHRVLTADAPKDDVIINLDSVGV